MVEVASESTAERDRGIKRRRYAHFGVPEYWIIDQTAGTVEVYRLALDPGKPKVIRDTLRWTPLPEGPTLEFGIAAILDISSGA